MSENTNTNTTVTDAPETEKHFSDVTPYQAAQIATLRLRKAGKLGEDETIAPQAMYSKKGIKRYGESKQNGGTGVFFVGDSFAAWLDAQVEGRQVAGGRRVNINELVKEYMGDLKVDEKDLEGLKDDETDEDDDVLAGLSDEESDEDAE